MRRHTAKFLILAAVVISCAACQAGRIGTATRPVSKSQTATGVLISSLRPATAMNLPPLKSDCIPSSTGSQPQIGVYAKFSGTATIKSPYGPIANATLSGSVCGIATVVNRPAGDCTTPSHQYASLLLRIPANGEHIDIPGVNITMFPNLSIPITHITVIPTPISAIVCAVAAPGPIKQTLTASLPVQAQTFGASCVIDATVPLVAEVYGPLSGFTISATNDPFTIPALRSSSSCPSDLTSVADKLLALPLAQPANEIEIKGTGVAYQP